MRTFENDHIVYDICAKYHNGSLNELQAMYQLQATGLSQKEADQQLTDFYRVHINPSVLLVKIVGVFVITVLVLSLFLFLISP